MTRTILTTAAVLALSAGSAFAGGNAYPTNFPAVTVQNQEPTVPTGGNAYPQFGGAKVTFEAGTAGLLPTNGSNGPVQSANSMPSVDQGASITQFARSLLNNQG